MYSPELKHEILKEIARKAYELQIKANLAQNDKMELEEIMTAERSIHHEIKRLRKLVRSLANARKKELKDLEEQIYRELNY
jgi:enoyl-[acyl-carrier-protein] reductase (NADH)